MGDLPICNQCAYRHEEAITDDVTIRQTPDIFSRTPGNRSPFKPNYLIAVDGHKFQQNSRSEARRIARKYADGRTIREIDFL